MAHFSQSWMMLFVSTILITEQAFASSQQLGPSDSKRVSDASVVRLGAPMSKNAVSLIHTLAPSQSTQQGNGKQVKQDLYLKKGEFNTGQGYQLQIHQGDKNGEMAKQQNGVLPDRQSTQLPQLPLQEKQKPQTPLQENQPVQQATQNVDSAPQQTPLVTKPSQGDQQQDNKNNNDNNCGGGCGCCCGGNNCGTNNNNDGKNNGQGNNNCCGCCCCCQPCCCCSPCGCCCQPCCCHHHDCCVHHVHHIEHHQCPCPCASPCCCECAPPCGCECIPPCGCCCSGGYGCLDPLCGGCVGCCGCPAPCGCGGWSCPCGCGGCHCNIFAIEKEESGNEKGKGKTEKRNGERRHLILGPGYLFPTYRHVRLYRSLERNKAPYSKHIHDRMG